MKLGDLFWVKKLKLKRDDYEYSDTIKIIKYLKDKLDIEVSFLEANTLWRIFSDGWYAGWLDVSDNTLEEFVNYFELM